jgi:phosphoglycerate kinase
MARTLQQLLQNSLQGKYVMVRIDANVEYTPDGIIDDLEGLRLDRALATIKELQHARGRIILVGHMGRDGSQSLQCVADYFKRKHSLDMTLVTNILDTEAHHQRDSMNDGDIILLENIRSFPEEESNDPEFAGQLARYADYYVDEAFSVTHRNHASVTGVPERIGGYMGINTEREYETVRDIYAHLDTSLICVGGAKFKTKLDLIRRALDQGAWVYVGGALAHTFYRARGMSIGASLWDDEDVDDIAHHDHLLLPDYVVVRVDEEVVEKHIEQIKEEDVIVDMGISSIDTLIDELPAGAFTHILWNGPVGWYEEGFVEGTIALGEWILAQNADTTIGGGDTVYVMQKYAPSVIEHYDFVSTGGGALLDLVIDGHLPGIDVLK